MEALLRGRSVLRHPATPVKLQQLDLGADFPEILSGKAAADEVGEKTRVERHQRQIVKRFSAAFDGGGYLGRQLEQLRKLFGRPVRNMYVPDVTKAPVRKKRVGRGTLEELTELFAEAEVEGPDRRDDTPTPADLQYIFDEVPVDGIASPASGRVKRVNEHERRFGAWPVP